MKKGILALAALMTVSMMMTACTSSDDVKEKLDGSGIGGTAEAGDNTGEEDNKEKDVKEFKHGVMTADSYTNSIFGIEVEFGSDWDITSEEEMAEYNQIDEMTDEALNKRLDTTATIYEMMVGIESGSNVNIVVENLKLTNNGKSITADKYIDSALKMLQQSLSSTYDQATAEKDKVTICGKEMVCIKAEISGNGITAKEVLIPVINGNYAAVITFTALDDEDMNTLMSAFKSIG